jgi:transcription elongation factor Elf1
MKATHDTKNFKISEFACPCCGKNETSQELLDKLQAIRDVYGFIMQVNSGYRCPQTQR